MTENSKDDSLTFEIKNKEKEGEEYAVIYSRKLKIAFQEFANYFRENDSRLCISDLFPDLIQSFNKLDIAFSLFVDSTSKAKPMRSSQNKNKKKLRGHIKSVHLYKTSQSFISHWLRFIEDFNEMDSSCEDLIIESINNLFDKTMKIATDSTKSYVKGNHKSDCVLLKGKEIQNKVSEVRRSIIEAIPMMRVDKNVIENESINKITETNLAINSLLDMMKTDVPSPERIRMKTEYSASFAEISRFFKAIGDVDSSIEFMKRCLINIGNLSSDVFDIAGIPFAIDTHSYSENVVGIDDVNGHKKIRTVIAFQVKYLDEETMYRRQEFKNIKNSINGNIIRKSNDQSNSSFGS